MPTANAETMSVHLDAINRKVAPGAHSVLVEAWNFFASDPPRIASITSRSWAAVSP
jgi:hypothetical protein